MTDIKPMNTKDIDKAAREYCREICKICGSRNECDRSELGRCLPTEDEFNAFITGAQSRQSEIDEFRKGLKDLYAVVGKLNDTNIKKHYSKLAIAYGNADLLLKKYGKK